jgi:aminoglycoside phosphotransferase (APT) family kinase protein
MESLTKRRISVDELAAIVREGFGAHAQVAAWSELHEGTYNAAYRVTLGDPHLDLVLKVAPDPRLELLTYERDLMRTEVHLYRRARSASVPVPEVAFADFSRRVLETDYVFLALLPGAPLNTVRERMSESEVRTVRAELARVTARLHTVEGTGFGYPLRASRTWQPTWRAAFGAMVDDLLADAVRLKSDLPAPPATIRTLIHRHDDVLEEVEHPAMVHFDLWDGNVLVDDEGAGRWRVTGLIDGERAFFGDPVAELVSLALYRDVAEVPELLAGYVAGSDKRPDSLCLGPDNAIALTLGGRRRLTLYSAYLYLIICVEGVTRGFDAPEYEAFRRRALRLLDLQLVRLGRQEAV